MTNFAIDDKLVLMLSVFGVLLLTTLTLIVGVTPLYAVGAVSFVLAIYYTFADPRMLLFALLIIRMSVDATAHFAQIAVTDTLILTLAQLLGIEVFLISILVFVRKYHRVPRLPLLWAFVLLLTWALGTIPISVSEFLLTTTLYEVMRIINILFVYFLAFTTITTPAQLRKLFHVLLIGALIPIGTALYQLLAGIGYTDIIFSTPRIFGTFAHPNIFGMYLVAMIAVGLLTIYHTPRQQAERHFALIMIVFFTVMLVLTFTRVAWVSLLILIGIMAVAQYRALIVPLIVVPLLLFVAIPQIHDRVAEALHPGVDSSITWRINLWDDTITRTIGDGRAWIGNGVNTFPIVAESVRGNRFGSTDPHNEYVRSFVEGGWIGLSIFALFIVATLTLLLRKIISARTTQEHMTFLILLALFVALAFASLSDHIFRSTPLQWIFYALLGGAISAYSNED